VSEEPRIPGLGLDRHRGGARIGLRRLGLRLTGFPLCRRGVGIAPGLLRLERFDGLLKLVDLGLQRLDLGVGHALRIGRNSRAQHHNNG
jgi:hypothetical protein